MSRQSKSKQPQTASRSTSVSKRVRIHDEVEFQEDTLILTRVTEKGENVTKQRYVLSKITADAVLEKRASGEPGLVFKVDSTYYFCRIPRKMRFLSQCNCGEHLCAICGHMSSLPDSEGGCRKVRDRSISTYDTSNFSSDTFVKSKRIEKYPFIKFGLESFNSHQDAFAVFQCENYCKIGPRPKISASEAKKLRESLAAYYDADDNE